MMVSALFRLSETGEASHGAVPAEFFGLAGFLVLALMLFIVTRFDPDR
jgi:hypothetical protein